MAMQLGALRDALMSPGDQDKANRAAEEVAGYENEFRSIRFDLSAIKVEVAGLRGEQLLQRWIMVSVFGLLSAVALKIFLH